MSESAAVFCDTWSIYDRLLDHNSMFHNELFDDIEEILTHRFGARPFSILELGCGSARHTAVALADRCVSRYVGYDLSEIALAHARENLARLGCPLDLRLGDLLAGVASLDDRYDVILSSFAIHHLAAEDKRRFFHEAAKHLNPGGMFLLIDPVPDESEDRATYLDRYCRWIQSDWRLPTEAAYATVIAHVRDFDFPETASTLTELAAEAGLVRSWEGRQFRWHRSFGFEPRQVAD